MRKINIEMPYANKKLFELIENKADGKVQKFAKMVGLSQQRINRLFNKDKRNGQYPNMTDEVKNVIIEHFKLNPNFFVPPATKEEVNPQNLFANYSPQNIGSLDRNNMPREYTRPRIPTRAIAGYLSEYVDGVMREDCEFLPIIQRFPTYDFTMIIKGNSMEPKYEGGDEIACKRVYDVIEWGKTYVLDTTDGAVVKRIYDAGEYIRCVSYNHEEYPDFLIEKSNVRGFYKVVGLVRI